MKNNIPKRNSENKLNKLCAVLFPTSVGMIYKFKHALRAKRIVKVTVKVLQPFSLSKPT